MLYMVRIWKGIIHRLYNFLNLDLIFHSLTSRIVHSLWRLREINHVIIIINMYNWVIWKRQISVILFLIFFHFLQAKTILLNGDPTEYVEALTDVGIVTILMLTIAPAQEALVPIIGYLSYKLLIHFVHI